MDQFQYKVLEPSADYRDAKIEKSGIKATFTLGEVEAHEAQLEKLRKETEGQIELEKAKMVNIEHFHPDIAAMDGEMLTGAALYKESKTYLEKAEPKLLEIIQALQEYADEKALIMQTLGFQKTTTPNEDDNGKATVSTEAK